jgi:hypothetical protein
VLLRKLAPLLILVAFGLSACASATRSRRRASTDGAATPPAAPKRRIDLAALETLSVVDRRPTAHPVGPAFASIRVNDLATGYGTRGRPPFAPGARLVESIAPDAESPATLYYAMTREPDDTKPGAGGWRYEVIDASGTVLAEGALPLCARCHAEAAREWVFEPKLRR